MIAFSFIKISFGQVQTAFIYLCNTLRILYKEGLTVMDKLVAAEEEEIREESIEKLDILLRG
jgi:hypothetical protein